MINLFKFIAYILFSCLDDKDQKKSQKVLAELENIDDECDQNDIAFVKIDDDKEAEEWGIDEIPTIVNIDFQILNYVYIISMILNLHSRYSMSVVFHTFTKAI